jgi:hypothetical protein
MNLYNFKINENTFSALSDALLEVQIEGTSISGSLKMGKLLLAPKFQLKTTIEVFKTTDLNAAAQEEVNTKGAKKPKKVKEDAAHRA